MKKGDEKKERGEATPVFALCMRGPPCRAHPCPCPTHPSGETSEISAPPGAGVGVVWGRTRGRRKARAFTLEGRSPCGHQQKKFVFWALCCPACLPALRSLARLAQCDLAPLSHGAVDKGRPDQPLPRDGGRGGGEGPRMGVPGGGTPRLANRHTFFNTHTRTHARRARMRVLHQKPAVRLRRLLQIPPRRAGHGVGRRAGHGRGPPPGPPPPPPHTPPPPRRPARPPVRGLHRRRRPPPPPPGPPPGDAGPPGKRQWRGRVVRGRSTHAAAAALPSRRGRGRGCGDSPRRLPGATATSLCRLSAGRC